MLPESSRNQPIISTSTFFLGCGGVLSAGMLYGVRRAMKQEKTTLAAVRGQPAFFMAFRAFGWGTALCFGAFTGGVIAFSLATGVRTTEDLARTARRSLVSLGISEELTAEKRALLEKESAELVENIEKDWEEITGNLSAKLSSWTRPSIKSSVHPAPESASSPMAKNTEELTDKAGLALFTHAIGVKVSKLLSMFDHTSSASSGDDNSDPKQKK